MKNKTNLITATIISLLFLIVFNISAFSYKCQEIRSNVIRLHILANSDSENDQDIKLKVRDAILEEGSDIFNGTVTVENATEMIIPELQNIEDSANKIIRINNENYSATASLVYEYFDTRTYNDDVTLPAGKYLALKIELGKAEGENWWCVMFPALCLPAAEKNNKNMINQVFSEEENNIIHDRSKYEIRFRIVELLEMIKDKGDLFQLGDIL